MKLTVIGSSSAGNGYIIHNDKTALIIECGCSLLEVKKALDFNISKIAGAIVSHSHGDHAGKVNEYLKNGIEVYMSRQTRNEVSYKSREPIIIKSNEMIMIGDFKIMPFELKHDVPIFGFLIYHPECGKVLFVTDTYYIPNIFNGLNQIMIEANYDPEILSKNIESGKLSGLVRDRVIRSHMSIETTKEALRSNDLSKVMNIVLIHLSDGNSNANDFKYQVESCTGKKVTIAEKGITIDFNKTEF
jgi:phosphoribosyl 1,2-cyclic phosphodiesterase